MVLLSSLFLLFLLRGLDQFIGKNQPGLFYVIQFERVLNLVDNQFDQTVFRADNLEGFVRLLRHSIDVKAELRTPTETVLLPVR